MPSSASPSSWAAADNLDPEQRENVQTITRSGTHLLSLINDILDMSKIEAGRAELNPAPFDLREMLAALEDMFSLRAQEKGLTLILDVAPDVPRHVTDGRGEAPPGAGEPPGERHQVHREGGATLRVRSRPEAAGDVRLVLRSGGHRGRESRRRRSGRCSSPSCSRAASPCPRRAPGWVSPSAAST